MMPEYLKQQVERIMEMGKRRGGWEKRRKAVEAMLRWPLGKWQEAVTTALAEGVVKNVEDPPSILRIENTMFTVGRHYGGMEYNKRHYTYVEPEVEDHAPNPDGTPYVAWVMVRDDLLEWVIARTEGEA